MTFSLAVIVPTVIGVGVVASFVLLAADGIARLRSTRRADRAVRILALGTATTVLARGADATRVGVRARGLALLAGAFFVSVGLYGLTGSFWNYWNPDSFASGVAWAWAVSTLLSLALVRIGVAAWSIARRDRPLRGTARALVVHSPLGADPGRVDRTPRAVAAREARGQDVFGHE